MYVQDVIRAHAIRSQFTYFNAVLQVPDENKVVLPGVFEFRTLQAADQTTVTSRSM